MLDRSHKTQILIVVLSLVNSLLLLVYIGALYKVGDLSEEVAKRENGVETVSVKSDEARKKALILKDIEPARQRVEEYFVDQNTYLPFLEYLEGLADTASITLKHQLTSPEGSLGFVMTFEGSFDDDMYFIALVESLPYNILVESVSVEKDGANPLWKGSMNISLLGSGQN